jgi:hypothetical protein
VKTSGPFKEESYFFEENDPFFDIGTDADVIPGFSSRLKSKTFFEVDLSPNSENTFGMDKRATTHAVGPDGGERSPRRETDPTIKQQLMVYWDHKKKRWEKIAQGVNGNVANNDVTYDFSTKLGGSFS